VQTSSAPVAESSSMGLKGKIQLSWKIPLPLRSPAKPYCRWRADIIMSHLDKLPVMRSAYYAIEQFRALWKASHVSATLLKGKSFVNGKQHYLPFFPIDNLLDVLWYDPQGCIPNIVDRSVNYRSLWSLWPSNNVSDICLDGKRATY